ncbi:COG1470 family protein [Aureispira anguillae]|uniref:Glycine rich protein n=1 Tax=Aureispira anguillae TaxID=2864201 RepID=A0A916DRU1_9BACT|nr:hypothetical protein [Aureispira anguillae]BDS12069.1 hypothetical protein AsAng_0027840 [Aureispira anguillae]
MKLLNKIFLLVVCFLCSGAFLEAQVGINILQPDTSAILHLESTDRGFLPPRMTTAQRDNIYSPKPGLTIFNSEDSTVQYYTGRCWLPVWQESCDDCLFDFSIENQNGNIDRIMGNSDSTRLFINQTNGLSSVGVYVIANLPQGITASIDRAVVTGTDTVNLTVTADIFAPAGTYPIVVQAACDGTIKSQVYVVTIDPCIEIDLIAPTVNYDLQAVNNLPTSTPVCVVLRIPPGLEMTNDTSGAPVYTSGNLHAQSRVGIWNEGFLLAHGGKGGVGAGLQGQTGEGAPGTHAMHLTTHTHLVNTGRIYGGGGGGGSVGFLATIPIPQPIGNFNLGIGAGGGGGAQLGEGGNLGTGFGYYEAGTAASGGMLALPGNGGVLTTPISFQVTVAQFTITPAVFGGNGGGYGLPGQEGSLSFNLDVTINIPFVGNVSIFNQNFPDPPLTVFPDGGAAGHAIKRNNNLLIGPIDGNYQTTNIKGMIGN